jgi:hypothetical protein
MAVRDTWEPSESDIAWVSNLMRIMKDGSSWGMPMNGTVYKIDHKNKRLTLVEGKVDGMFFRNKKCFAKIGYEVME